MKGTIGRGINNDACRKDDKGTGVNGVISVNIAGKRLNFKTPG